MTWNALPTGSLADLKVLSKCLYVISKPLGAKRGISFIFGPFYLRFPTLHVTYFIITNLPLVDHMVTTIVTIFSVFFNCKICLSTYSIHSNTEIET